jgi:hypothetical protein
MSPEELDILRRQQALSERVGNAKLEELADLRRRRDEADVAQKKKEADAAGGPAGTAGSVLSMLSSVGGAIPTLLQQPEKGALKAAQRGQGAGATIARQTASEAGRRVAGNVQGSDLREGLRSADRLTAQGAAQASTIGAQESLAATQQLRQGTNMRRGAGMRFGAGVGQGLASISGTLAASKDQGPVQPGVPGESAEDGAFPVRTPDEVAEDQQRAFIDESEQKLGAFQQERMNLMPPADQGPELPAQSGGPGDPVFDQQQQNLSGIPSALSQPSAGPQGGTGGGQTGQDSYQTPQGSLGPTGGQGVPDAIAIASDPNFNMEKSVAAMANAGMLREEAVAGYVALHTGDEQSSNAAAVNQDPGGVAEYIYGEAANYNPTINQGLEPWEAAKTLQVYGLPVDWERLGIPLAQTTPRAQLGREASESASAAGEKIRSAFTGGDKGQ